MNIVFSRPIRAETQPKKRRVSPFSKESSEREKVRAGRVRPTRLTGTDATECRSDVERGERVGGRVHHPGDSDKNPDDEDHDFGPEPIDEPALDRNQPSLGEDENRECYLDGRAPPVILFVDRANKQ